MVSTPKTSADTAPLSAAVLPLRKPELNLSNLHPGNAISFSSDCSLPQLAGKTAVLTQLRTYRFGDDLQTSYSMNVGGQEHFSLTVAEDEEGYYLAVARELAQAEQDAWFGRDALGFFTEASTAKTIRCKADMMIEGDWAASRYSKLVDWIDGSVLLGRQSPASLGRQVKQIHYNLLVNETGDRALEIEHEDDSGANRILVTVYRPVSDIAAVADSAPAEVTTVKPLPLQSAPVNDNSAMPTAANGEAPLFLDTPARTDFRRLNGYGAPIHVIREDKPQPALDTIMQASLPPLPSFLMAREHSYLSLDEVIPPETDRMRCDLRSAKVMIDLAIARGVRVRDILRELIGLDSMLNDEVIFELPLSDSDYRQLAMRYKVRPDHRDEIRARLQAELAERLIGVAKR